MLLLQLGTPDSTQVRDVRKYLREFLADPRVLDIPAPARTLLLNAVILPFRPRRSAEQYRKIWTDQGSPLMVHTDRLAGSLQEALGDSYLVKVAMRYQSPSIEAALEDLAAAGCERVVVAPMFPQYSSAAYGSAVARVKEVLVTKWNVPAISTVPPFYDHPGFVRSVAVIARPLLDEFRPDHVLFSYHGLPESQIEKSDPTGDWCLQRSDCCQEMRAENRFCYRAQSYATTRAVAGDLDLEDGSHSTAFQSRLAGQKWIEPYTDGVLQDLYDSGARRLAVLTPSFVADCLETLEEIGIRLRDQWEGIGGEDLLLVPCVNASPQWAEALTEMIRLESGSDHHEQTVGGELANTDPIAVD